MKVISLLLIEDELAIRDMLRLALPTAEFQLRTAENISQATQQLLEHLPDLILLDWLLPGKNGLEFLKWLRQQELYKNIPVIMLSAKVEEENKLKGLLTGADDYVTKPFSPAELKARIKTILRRGLLISPAGEIKMDSLAINVDLCRAYAAGEPLALTPIEYKMLHFFMLHPDKTFTRDQLISHIRGGNVYIDDRTIDVQIRRLRNKLKPYGYHQWIKTVRGSGYYFSYETIK